MYKCPTPPHHRVFLTSPLKCTDGCGSQSRVLDSLVRTILSQNTTDATSHIAFARLKKTLPTWLSFLQAAEGVAEEAVRCGGLAERKCGWVRVILQDILDAHGQELKVENEPDLDFLRDWKTEDVKRFLGKYKGVGPKTVSCVLMFAMHRAEFPVDTHVWKIARALGWVWEGASREKTYTHLNKVIPDGIKFDLHVLFVRHGKRRKNELGILEGAVVGEGMGKKVKREVKVEEGEREVVEERPQAILPKSDPT